MKLRLFISQTKLALYVFDRDKDDNSLAHFFAAKFPEARNKMDFTLADEYSIGVGGRAWQTEDEGRPMLYFHFIGIKNGVTESKESRKIKELLKSIREISEKLVSMKHNPSEISERDKEILKSLGYLK